MTYKQIIALMSELSRHACRYVSNPIWADDAAADALYSTVRRLGLAAYSTDPDTFRAMAFATTKNKAKTVGRTERRREKKQEQLKQQIVGNSRPAEDRIAATIDAVAALSLVNDKTTNRQKEALRNTLDENRSCTPAEHTRVCRTRARLANDAQLAVYDIGRPAA